jgi:hypothetical protein
MLTFCECLLRFVGTPSLDEGWLSSFGQGPKQLGTNLLIGLCSFSARTYEVAW